MIEDHTQRLLQISKYGKPIIKGEGFEIRLNDDGTLDEIVTYDTFGRCNFHLEQMSDDSYWMGLYPRDNCGLHANFGVKKGKLWTNAYSNGGEYWAVPTVLTPEHLAEMERKQDAYIEELRERFKKPQDG